MATQADIGYGTILQIFDTVSSPPMGWVNVAEVTSITPPNMTRDAQDATHTESPGGWREFIPGLKDAGEVSAELNFVAASDTTALLIAQFDSREVAQARILFSDGDQEASPPTCSVWSFSAILTAFPPEAPVDGKMTAATTFKISGRPTFQRALGQ